MIFNYTVNQNIPQAAWCAVVEEGNEAINVELGRSVPHNALFFVVGVWDGDFQSGRFDSAHFPCCTGGRLLKDVNSGGG